MRWLEWWKTVTMKGGKTECHSMGLLIKHYPYRSLTYTYITPYRSPGLKVPKSSVHFHFHFLFYIQLAQHSVVALAGVCFGLWEGDEKLYFIWQMCPIKCPQTELVQPFQVNQLNEGINPTSLLAYDNTAATAKALPGDWSVVRCRGGGPSACSKHADLLPPCWSHHTLWNRFTLTVGRVRHGLTLTPTLTITITLHRTLYNWDGLGIGQPIPNRLTLIG